MMDTMHGVGQDLYDIKIDGADGISESLRDLDFLGSFIAEGENM